MYKVAVTKCGRNRNWLAQNGSCRLMFKHLFPVGGTTWKVEGWPFGKRCAMVVCLEVSKASDMPSVLSTSCLTLTVWALSLSFCHMCNGPSWTLTLWSCKPNLILSFINCLGYCVFYPNNRKVVFCGRSKHRILTPSNYRNHGGVCSNFKSHAYSLKFMDRSLPLPPNDWN